MNGVNFGTINSYRDLNLVLSSVTISPAEPKLTYIDIPGRDGSLDLSESLGEIKFKNRTATFVFTTLPSDNIQAKQRQVSNLLNGVNFERIILDKDPSYYYSGRCKVSSYKEEYPTSTITVTANLEPWRMRTSATTLSIEINATPKQIMLTNSRKPVIPKFTASVGTMITFNSYTTFMTGGTKIDPNIRLVNGDNLLFVNTVSGSGNLIIEYREGAL